MHKWYGLLCTCWVLCCGIVGHADQDEAIARLLQLGKISIGGPPSRVEVDPSEEVARSQFSLTDETTRRFLSQIIQVRRSSNFMNGLTGVLLAHRAGGVHWALGELAKSDSPAVRSNLAFALRFFNYREVAIVYMALLDDTRELPPPWLIPGHDRMPGYSMVARSSGCGPERICDQAAYYMFGVAMCCLPHEPMKLPERFKGMNPNFGPSSLTKERDEGIAMLKAWWKEEGERLAMEKRPSFIDDLLKKPQQEADKKPADENEKPK